jgi:aminoglycoside phosphotransferase (APT) family kinase protein
VTLQQLDEAEAVRDFLRAHGVFAPEEAVHITFLAGGVSSVVVRAEGQRRCVVIKQALPRLKVRDEWLSRVERSLIEARAATVLRELVPHSVPAPVAVDEARYAFAMECAPDGAEPWKSLLMAGTVDPRTAAAAGQLLGRVHARSAARTDLEQQFEDRSFFEELRVDPYLRTIARRHPDLADRVERIIDELLATRVCLVHGDYSPKNLLVSPDHRLLLLDHEVAHWGNPAFDAAFVLNHLCLKALKFPGHAGSYLTCASELWDRYRAESPPGGLALAEQTARLLGGLMLARVDGKSPVEYLETDAERSRVRSVARELISDRVSDVPGVFERVDRAAVHA